MSDYGITAINTLIDNAITKLEYNRTEIGTIIEIDNSKQNKYIIKINNVTYDAYSSVSGLAVDDKVIVVEQSTDFLPLKVIIGKMENEELFTSDKNVTFFKNQEKEPKILLDTENEYIESYKYLIDNLNKLQNISNFYDEIGTGTDFSEEIISLSKFCEMIEKSIKDKSSQGSQINESYVQSFFNFLNKTRLLMSTIMLNAFSYVENLIENYKENGNIEDFVIDSNYIKDLIDKNEIDEDFEIESPIIFKYELVKMYGGENEGEILIPELCCQNNTILKFSCDYYLTFSNFLQSFNNLDFLLSFELYDDDGNNINNSEFSLLNHSIGNIFEFSGIPTTCFYEYNISADTIKKSKYLLIKFKIRNFLKQYWEYNLKSKIEDIAKNIKLLNKSQSNYQEQYDKYLDELKSLFHIPALIFLPIKFNFNFGVNQKLPQLFIYPLEKKEDKFNVSLDHINQSTFYLTNRNVKRIAFKFFNIEDDEYKWVSSLGDYTIHFYLSSNDQPFELTTSSANFVLENEEFINVFDDGVALDDNLSFLYTNKYFKFKPDNNLLTEKYSFYVTLEQDKYIHTKDEEINEEKTYFILDNGLYLTVSSPDKNDLGDYYEKTNNELYTSNTLTFATKDIIDNEHAIELGYSLKPSQSVFNIYTGYNSIDPQVYRDGGYVGIIGAYYCGKLIDKQNITSIKWYIKNNDQNQLWLFKIKNNQYALTGNEFTGEVVVTDDDTEGIIQITDGEEDVGPIYIGFQFYDRYLFSRTPIYCQIKDKNGNIINLRQFIDTGYKPIENNSGNLVPQYRLPKGRYPILMIEKDNNNIRGYVEVIDEDLELSNKWNELEISTSLFDTTTNNSFKLSDEQLSYSVYPSYTTLTEIALEKITGYLQMEPLQLYQSGIYRNNNTNINLNSVQLKENDYITLEILKENNYINNNRNNILFGENFETNIKLTINNDSNKLKNIFLNTDQTLKTDKHLILKHEISCGWDYEPDFAANNVLTLDMFPQNYEYINIDDDSIQEIEDVNKICGEKNNDIFIEKLKTISQTGNVYQSTTDNNQLFTDIKTTIKGTFPNLKAYILNKMYTILDNHVDKDTWRSAIINTGRLPENATPEDIKNFFWDSIKDSKYFKDKTDTDIDNMNLNSKINESTLIDFFKTDVLKNENASKYRYFEDFFELAFPNGIDDIDKIKYENNKYYKKSYEDLNFFSNSFSFFYYIDTNDNVDTSETEPENYSILHFQFDIPYDKRCCKIYGYTSFDEVSETSFNAANAEELKTYYVIKPNIYKRIDSGNAKKYYLSTDPNANPVSSSDILQQYAYCVVDKSIYVVSEDQEFNNNKIYYYFIKCLIDENSFDSTKYYKLHDNIFEIATYYDNNIDYYSLMIMDQLDVSGETPGEDYATISNISFYFNDPNYIVAESRRSFRRATKEEVNSNNIQLYLFEPVKKETYPIMNNNQTFIEYAEAVDLYLKKYYVKVGSYFLQSISKRVEDNVQYFILHNATKDNNKKCINELYEKTEYVQPPEAYYTSLPFYSFIVTTNRTGFKLNPEKIQFNAKNNYSSDKFFTDLIVKEGGLYGYFAQRKYSNAVPSIEFANIYYNLFESDPNNYEANNILKSILPVEVINQNNANQIFYNNKDIEENDENTTPQVEENNENTTPQGSLQIITPKSRSIALFNEPLRDNSNIPSTLETIMPTDYSVSYYSDYELGTGSLNLLSNLKHELDMFQSKLDLFSYLTILKEKALEAALFTPRLERRQSNLSGGKDVTVSEFWTNVPSWYQGKYYFPNCTCYAWGRYAEASVNGDLSRLSEGLAKARDLPRGDAGEWFVRTHPNKYPKRSAYDFNNEQDKHKYLGAICVWSGHVGIIEKIDLNNGNTKLLISESGYHTGYIFKCQVWVYKSNGYNFGRQEFKGFILQR